MPHPGNRAAPFFLRAFGLAAFLCVFNALSAHGWSGICIDTAQRVNQAEGLPANLLSSIAITESGRTDPATKAKVAWPWTVTSGGEGQYFPTKAAAIAAVKRLQRAGVENIDVGCMQINLKYHPDAFSSLAEAFEPEVNVRYAARFLKDLRQAWNGWSEAVRHYHSADAERGRAYERRVAANHRDLLSDVPATRSFARPTRTARTEIKPVRVADNSEVQRQRAEARAEAAAWRQKKLEEYLARRAAQRDG